MSSIADNEDLKEYIHLYNIMMENLSNLLEKEMEETHKRHEETRKP